ncbi:MAG: hypothetical protein SWX82_30495 [Cyanobacteriota bacterium]|nr:hypothetical protein [Cyanobacteriota bacterium]
MSQKIKETYPVILIPTVVQNIAVALPEAVAPEIIEKPSKEQPQKPTFKVPLPSKIDTKTLIIWLAVGMMLASTTMSILVVIVTVLLIFYIYNKEKTSYGERKTEYDIKRYKYQTNLEKYELESQKWLEAQSNYRASTSSYTQKLKTYNGIIDELNTKVPIAKKEFNKLSNIELLFGSNAPKGRTEKSFFRVLNQHFPDVEILTDYQVVKYQEFPYTPDFIYYDSRWNLYIDIEIDEPYNGVDKKPTHCIDVDKDKNRDDFFVSNNWVVIRFAEEQVMRQPESCCRFIAKTILFLTGKPIPDVLKKTEDLMPINRWNLSRAKKMARENYRDEY